MNYTVTFKTMQVSYFKTCLLFKIQNIAELCNINESLVFFLSISVFSSPGVATINNLVHILSYILLLTYTK